jgi:Asp-tRNA(Asn)/Glu-tRNA(Gln) amidotransferase A subunit family amidase
MASVAQKSSQWIWIEHPECSGFVDKTQLNSQCEEESMTTATDTSPVNPDQVAAAVRLIGLEYTAAEIEQTVAALVERLDQYGQLRAFPLNPDLTPALTFHPAPLADITSATPPPGRPIQLTDDTPITRPNDEVDLAFASVADLSHLIRTRQVSSLELTELYLNRLHRYDPSLECVVTLTPELARAQARRADKELAQGLVRSPLHGLPWGAKDLLATRGIRTTWGAEPYRMQIPNEDATVVQRLEEAGAVLVAKLTTGALAMGDIWFGGQTKNPWDLTEGASGSSAGPGAATAAGLVGFSIGTETMGSILSPSARCEITGLRPTFGRVSRAGSMALSWSMDKIGPMCRSAEDCALVLNAIYGPDGRDATVVDQPFDWPPALDLRQLHIGYVPSHFEGDSEENIFCRQALDVLRDLGVQLTPIELPDYPHEALMIILFAEAAAAFDGLTRHGQDDLLKRQDEKAWPNLLRIARLIPAVEYLQANRIRTQLMAAIHHLLTQVDLLVQPFVWGKDIAITNYTGHPAVLIPSGFSTESKPVSSLVLSGRLYDEATILAVAHAFQSQTEFHRRRPPLFSESNL